MYISKVNEDASRKAIQTVLNVVQKYPNAKTELMELFNRIDHIAYGCYCEYPVAFKTNNQQLYTRFRSKFDFESTPRPMRSD